MFPFVVGLAMAMGVLSGWLTAVNLLDLSTVEFMRGLKLFFRTKDVWFGLLKSASFGLTISLVGCVKGLSADRGAEAVGRATTDAVVLSAMLILVLDALWAVMLL
jgi:phospholipid/cholesterol/gamma-HCH transport system permease protein